jgi:type IV secretion system protein VirD4
MLPQEVEMLPENDLIVFRRGMYATYGKKVRYYSEKKLAARTKIPPPAMPTIRVDPAVAHNSLRVIAAAEGDAGDLASRGPVSNGTADAEPSVAPAYGRLNRAAIAAAMAVPPAERTNKLFEHLVTLAPPAAAPSDEPV